MTNFKFLTILFLGMFAVATAIAQAGNIDSIKYSGQLIAIEQRLVDAIPGGDTAIWNSYLDEQFFIVTEDGSRLGRAAFLATLTPMPKGFRGWIKITNPRLSFNGNVAVVNVTDDETEFISGQQLHTTYSTMDTYVKKDTGWKLLASQIFEVPQLPVAIKIAAATLKKYTGTYRLTDTVTCSISLLNDTLFIQKKGRPKEALLPETENVFFRKTDTRGRKIFSLNEDGVMMMRERRNGQDVVWRREGR